jgi:hypothetical protein
MTLNEIFRMVCLHEAGHAVATHALNLPLGRITARVPDGDPHWGGFEITAGPDINVDDGNPATREYLEKRIIQCLAGPAAECRYTKCSPFKAGGTDLVNTVKFACRRYAYQTEAELITAVTRLWECTKELLSDEERWEYVTRIADALEKQRTDRVEMCVLEPEAWTRIIDAILQTRRMADRTEVMRIMDHDGFNRVEQSLSDSLSPRFSA